MTSFSSSGGVMEEVIERVSAILDSPVLRYTRHKTYRQMSVLCLVYLMFFYSFVFAAKEGNFEFEPYQKKTANTQIHSKTKDSGAGNKYISPTDTIQKIEASAKAMNEVEEIFLRLETSVNELIEAEPISDEDQESVLKTLAQVDGVLSYVYIQLKSGKEQLSSITPITNEEIAEYNSLKVKFMSYMKLANDLKKSIAEKLADASKRIDK